MKCPTECFVLAVLAGSLCLVVAGCGSRERGDDQTATSGPPAPQIVVPDASVVVNEGEPLLFRPEISNADEMVGPLVFALRTGSLPEGCSLNESTGELQWTPTETQGPGSYALDLVCHPEDVPDAATPYAATIDVREANSRPRLEAPDELTLMTGAVLEVPLRLSDEDFPANQLRLELSSGPDGAVVDDLGRLLYWEIPSDWQQPRVELTVTARDDGTPPEAAMHTLIVNVTDITPPAPKVVELPYRLPETAVDLPDLPSIPLRLRNVPVEPVEIKPAMLELDLDPPIDPDDLRLSLLVHDDLKGLLKTQYVDNDDTQLEIRLTEPFEAEDAPGNLENGIAARCVFRDGMLYWTWAMTKDSKARWHQNALRSAVLTLGSRSGAKSRLVALHAVKEVLAPSLAELLGRGDKPHRLLRRDKVAKTIALEGVNCAADNGNWQVELHATIDGFSTVLTSPRLLQYVNSRIRGGIQFENFGFRFIPHLDEFTVELDATPSPPKVFKELSGARGALNANINRRDQETRKYNAALLRLSSAESMVAKSPAQRRQKATNINKAKVDAARSKKRLDELAVKIPADRKAVADWEAKWKAIQVQLQPLKDCVFYGELWRHVGDVRVPVLRVVQLD